MERYIVMRRVTSDLVISVNGNSLIFQLTYLILEILVMLLCFFIGFLYFF